MRKTQERPQVSPGFNRKTLIWVGGIHILIILLLACVSFLNRPKPPEKLLQMVELGSANPGNGAASGSEKGTTAGGNPSTAKNSDEAPPPLPPIRQSNPAPPEPIKKVEPEKVEVKPDPTPVKPEKVEPVIKKTEPVVKKTEPIVEKKVEKVKPEKPEVKEPVKETKPTEAKTTKPKADPDKAKDDVKKPTKTPIKVDLTQKVKRVVPGSTSASATDDGSADGKEGGKKNGVKNGVSGSNGTNPEAKGPSASDIRGALSKGLQSVGVVGGTGSGAAGSPDGSAYNALIKKTLTGNWVKPTSSSADLKTLVKIRIKPDGTVEVIGISLPSGDKTMDQSVLDAVRSTGKLSKPLPDGLGSPDYEVVVNFQLD